MHQALCSLALTTLPFVPGPSFVSAWALQKCFSSSSYSSNSPLSKNDYHSNPGVLRHINPLIGTSGTSPNNNGGMIPSLSPPFGKTRWTPQTRENFISQCPYHDADRYIHGFQATHQPAIWMGESGQAVLSPGWGGVEPAFERRGLRFEKDGERSEVYVYEVVLDAETEGVNGKELMESFYSPVPGGGQVVPEDVREGANGRGSEGRRSSGGRIIKVSDLKAALTATSQVGHLRLDFINNSSSHSESSTFSGSPYVFIQATRQNWTGHVDIDSTRREISGSNPQRQDYALGPSRAPSFRGYFVSRFSEPFDSFGTTYNSSLVPNAKSGNGSHLGAYATFPPDTKRVEVRTGVSFVSVEQARRNLDIEIPDGTTFSETVESLKAAWLNPLSTIKISGVNKTSHSHSPLSIFYTALYHALQYPSDFSEPLSPHSTHPRTFYSGYTDTIHTTNDAYYQSWSIWDTYRAASSLLTLFAPSRVNSMMRSLLTIYSHSGRLPMWANVVETNIMISTHVDALLANALARGFTGFNISLAWEAVRKNAEEPPERDQELLFYDREPYTPAEARAGLSFYKEHGFVANDRWAESASRTLDYAFDDHAAAVVARAAGDEEAAKALEVRSQNYRSLWNGERGFMQARNANGSWAEVGMGWTEGDEWVYTFDVMHDVPGLISLFENSSSISPSLSPSPSSTPVPPPTSSPSFLTKLTSHFSSHHNDHTNEPSHHLPYLFTLAGRPSTSQTLIRSIAYDNYNNTPAGLSGNEDLGQMSAWYVFSALGFYPVDPVGEEYVVGSPFFGEVGWGIDGHELIISAPDAPTKPYVKSLKVDGVSVFRPVLTHSQIIGARRIEFEMAEEPQEWGSGRVW
ncbi:glycoside hydrolase family 92 protein [Aulographum hederae CBS 113979]|uniref:Glycoside hydrolase family 92 protein n=1 Tax=Aulographum hederae CBS 113979 TaxID=1176131 RepID=A0A6G1H9S8_9PEZI|nr:glycoside hydrolase family 92 protein [Aulographum hederae CBS 113979]